MSERTIVQDFLHDLDPEDVPLEYISAASIRDIEGREVVLRGEQLKMLMESHPDYRHVKDARVYIDLKRVMTDVSLEVEYIFETVQAMFLMEERKNDPLV